MSQPSSYSAQPYSALYHGLVTHRRLRPVAHHLSYKVASLMVNVDDLGTSRLPSLLRYNRVGLFSISDRDHGEGAPIASFAWQLADEAGAARVVKQIFMLCYPRMLGFGFNPLTVYFGVDATGDTRFLIYEVRNTFGGRHIYRSELLSPGEAAFQQTPKLFRVSPFNKVEGAYGLRATSPLENLTIGVSLETDDGPTLKAYFKAERSALTNASLLRLLASMPLMTFKIVAAIHWEALKLWRKGLKLQSA
jgi:uncharacterized protein